MGPERSAIKSKTFFAQVLVEVLLVTANPAWAQWSAADVQVGYVDQAQCAIWREYDVAQMQGAKVDTVLVQMVDELR